MPGGPPLPSLGTTWGNWGRGALGLRAWSSACFFTSREAPLGGTHWGRRGNKGSGEEQEEGSFPWQLLGSQASESPHKVSLSSYLPRVLTRPQVGCEVLGVHTPLSQDWGKAQFDSWGDLFVSRGGQH